jgi:hypothetical protein
LQLLAGWAFAAPIEADSPSSTVVMIAAARMNVPSLFIPFGHFASFSVAVIG